MSRKSEIIHRNEKKNIVLHDLRERELFYHSYKWNHLRLWAISVYGKVCLNCGKFCQSVHVDHIHCWYLHHEQRLDPHNVQVLCSKCNKTKAGKTADYRIKDMGHLYIPPTKIGPPVTYKHNFYSRNKPIPAHPGGRASSSSPKELTKKQKRKLRRKARKARLKKFKAKLKTKPVIKSKFVPMIELPFTPKTILLK